MKYEKMGSGRDENRTPLYKQVPLKLPYTVGIGVSDFCNFKCVYCGHSTDLSSKIKEKILSFEEFAKIVDEIKELCNMHGGEKIKNFAICGIGEPLICKDLPKMVKYVKEKDFSDRIEITTNGSLLTHELSDALINSGLTRLLISIQGVSVDAYKQICDYNIDFNKLIEEIKYFYEHKKQCQVYIKTLDVALNEEERTKFYDIFSPIADIVNIEHMEKVFEGVNYDAIVSDENVKQTRYGYKWQERICCDSLFMRMNINTNGGVDACACRYPALCIGNLHHQPLNQIWNGELHRKYMKLHLTGNRNKIERCKNCDIVSLGGHPMDNLDEHMEEILEKLRNM